MFGELLTTVEDISNVLAAFRRKGEGRIFIRSTPETARAGGRVWFRCLRICILVSTRWKTDDSKGDEDN